MARSPRLPGPGGPPPPPAPTAGSDCGSHRPGEPGPEVGFHVELPEAGKYALWLDFQHDGVVRTAAFMVEQQAIDEPTDEHHEQEGEGHDH